MENLLTNNNELIWNSTLSLYNWSKKENYYGWDIYDALNSDLVKKICIGSYHLEVLITQFNKYSPINFRHVLKIKKGVDAKGMALFAQSFTKLYKITNDDIYIQELNKCIDFFKKESVKSVYQYDCWAHYFNYTTIDKSVLSPKEPDVITTSNVIKALVDSYFIIEDHDLLKLAKSAFDFLVYRLLRKTDQGLYYLMYSPVADTKMVINASALGLDAISKLLALYRDDPKMKEIASNLCDTLLKTQKEDGSWVYSIYHNGKERVQTDFHQGFIIDGLLEYVKVAEPGKKNKIFECIHKGINFYRKVQFQEDGRCHFRYPQFYPTEIHAQAQGIITFSKYSFYDSDILDFSRKIAHWTIKNMQDNSGYFYYYKSPFFVSKIPYMRWGQAWMLLALTTFLEIYGESLHD